METPKTYSNSSELKGNTLDVGNRVLIAHYLLEVKISSNSKGVYLTRVDEKDDEKIFKFFLIYKKKFFRKHLGFEPTIIHGFSRFYGEDSKKVLTNIAVDLMERYEKYGWFYDLIKKTR